MNEELQIIEVEPENNLEKLKEIIIKYQILNEKCDLILNKIRSRKGLTIKS